MEKAKLERRIERYYVLKAAIFAPWIAPFAYLTALECLSKGVLLPEPGLVKFLVALLSAVTYSVPFAYLCLALLGYPIFLILRMLALVKWWSLSGAGLIIGAFIGKYVFELRGWEIAYFATPGVAVAFFAWFLYTHRSSNHSLNKDAAQPAPRL